MKYVYVALLFKAGQPVDMRVYKTEAAARQAYSLGYEWVTITRREIIA